MRKKGKGFYVSEVDEKVLKEDEKKVISLLNGFKKDYMRFMKEMNKENLQVRTFSAELLLNSIITDSNLHFYTTLGILDKIKSEIISNKQPKEITYIPDTKPRGYVS